MTTGRHALFPPESGRNRLPYPEFQHRGHKEDTEFTEIDSTPSPQSKLRICNPQIQNPKSLVSLRSDRLLIDQIGVQIGYGNGHRPADGPGPTAVHERAHLLLVGRELDQGDDGER